MTENIELQGYETLIRNCVYRKRLEDNLCKDCGNDRTLTQLIRLATYKVPTDEQLLRFIVDESSKVTSSETARRVLLPNSCLRMVPEQVLERIAFQEDEVVDGIRTNFLRDKLEPGKAYLRVDFTKTPARLIEDNHEIMQIIGQDAYDQVIDSGEGWGMLVKLIDGRFPTNKAGSIPFNYGRIEPKEVSEGTDFIYDFTWGDNILSVPDRTKDVFKVRAQGTIKNYLSSIGQRLSSVSGVSVIKISLGSGTFEDVLKVLIKKTGKTDPDFFGPAGPNKPK